MYIYGFYICICIYYIYVLHIHTLYICTHLSNICRTYLKKNATSLRYIKKTWLYIWIMSILHVNIHILNSIWIILYIVSQCFWTWKQFFNSFIIFHHVVVICIIYLLGPKPNLHDCLQSCASQCEIEMFPLSLSY